jgi:uncharacterized RDD family membrane protein YckC
VTQMDTQPVPARAGFWRRVVAITLDVFIVSAIVTVVGIGLATVTGGAVRVGGAPPNTNASVISPDTNGTHCERSDLEPAERQALSLPSDFKVSSVGRCTAFAFGIPYDWMLSVSEQIQTGNVTHRRNMALPLDPTGHLTRAFYLNVWLIFFVAFYLLVCEWRFGATIGKRLVGIRVRTLDGARMNFGQAGKRVLIRMVPFLPAMVLASYATIVGPMKFAGSPILDIRGHSGNNTSTAHYWLGFNLTMPTLLNQPAVWLFVIVFAGNFIIAASRRKLPWHDRWAQTEATRRW